MDYEHINCHYIKNQKGKTQIKLSFAIESLYSMLIANKQTILHDRTISEPEWRKMVIRLFDKLEITIKNSVKTDRDHFDQILYTIKMIKESFNDFYKFQPEIILQFLFLSFFLIGGIPNLRKQSKHNSNYVSNRYRTVKFEQNDFQRVQLLLTYAHKINKFEEFDREYSLLGFKDDKFIKWVKSKYPQIYCELF